MCLEAPSGHPRDHPRGSGVCKILNSELSTFFYLISLSMGPLFSSSYLHFSHCLHWFLIFSCQNLSEQCNSVHSNYFSRIQTLVPSKAATETY